VAVDPHKWLYAPLEAGCALVRDAAALRNAFSYHPPYYHFGVEATNYVDFGLQNSRGFRALKVWLALRQAGRDGYARMIGDDIASRAASTMRVAAHPELEPFTCGLSISTFRYVPPACARRIGDARRRGVAQPAERGAAGPPAEGRRRVRLERRDRGRYVLRACIVNFNTTSRTWTRCRRSSRASAARSRADLAISA
jgi:aromatic-L-amino-acid/L-tryptophan decarboxylase